MSSIKELVTCFCAVSVMCGAFNLLAGKTLEKSFKYILALIFLCVVVSSFTKMDLKFNFKKSTVTASYSQSVIDMSEYQTEYIIGELLNKNNIKYTEISATAYKLSDGSIVINEIKLIGVDNISLAEELILNSNVTKTVKFE